MNRITTAAPIQVGPVRTLVGPDVPAALRHLTPLSELDYADATILPVAGRVDATPLDIARVICGDLAGWRGQFVWRVVLGLRLAWPSSADHVAGWRVGAQGPGWIRLDAESYLLTGHLVFHSDETALSVGTFIRFRHSAGRLVWSRLADRHTRAVRGMLAESYRRTSGTRATPV